MELLNAQIAFADSLIKSERVPRTRPELLQQTVWGRQNDEVVDAVLLHRDGRASRTLIQLAMGLKGPESTNDGTVFVGHWWVENRNRLCTMYYVALVKKWIGECHEALITGKEMKWGDYKYERQNQSTFATVAKLMLKEPAAPPLPFK